MERLDQRCGTHEAVVGQVVRRRTKDVALHERHDLPSQLVVAQRPRRPVESDRLEVA